MKYCQWKRRRMQKGPDQGLWGPLLAVARGHCARAILILSGFWLPLLVVHAEAIRPDICLEILMAGHNPVARLQAELAATPAAQRQGLMERLLPDDASGMLFVFPEAAPRAFWMRNTPGSLDMLFADNAGRIHHIARETQPFSDQRYLSQGPAQYVLETRGGFAGRQGIVPGMTLAWRAGPCADPLTH